MPQISVITITYNAEQFLERTIKSIEMQGSSDYEYIIIDGGSSDKTLKIAEKYKHLVTTLVSEPDNGLYDAMNKGITHANGKYIWFMNAGDEIAEPNALFKLDILFKKGADVIFGETAIFDTEGNYKGNRSEVSPHKLPQNLSWDQYGLGMLVCHQSFIVKKEIAPDYIENNLSADIDWEIKCLKNAKLVLKYEGILANYLEGGISHTNMFKSWKDRYIVLKNHFGFFGNLKNHFRIIFRADLKNIFRLSKYIK